MKCERPQSLLQIGKLHFKKLRLALHAAIRHSLFLLSVDSSSAFICPVFSMYLLWS